MSAKKPPLYVITSLMRGIVRTTDYTIHEGSYLLYRVGDGKFLQSAPKANYFGDVKSAQAKATNMRVRRIASLKRRVEAEETLLGKPVPVTPA